MKKTNFKAQAKKGLCYIEKHGASLLAIKIEILNISLGKKHSKTAFPNSIYDLWYGF